MWCGRFLRRAAVCRLALVALGLLPAADAQTGTLPLNPPCGELGIIGSEVAIEFDDLEQNPYLIATLVIYDDEGIAVAPSSYLGFPNTGPGAITTIPLDIRVKDECDTFIDFGGGGSSPEIPTVYYPGVDQGDFPVTLELRYGNDPNGTGTLDHVYRILYGADSLSGSFFNPHTVSPGNADFYMLIEPTRVRVSPDDWWNVVRDDGTRGLYVDDLVPDDGWVLPYHWNALCAPPVTCGMPVGDLLYAPFLMPVSEVFEYGEPLVKPLTPSLSMTLPNLTGTNDYAWGESWLTLAFGPGTGLDLLSDGFSAAGMTFTAADPALGWSGITVPGGVAVLDGARVEGVSFAGQTFKKPVSAVTVSGGGSLTLRGGAVVTGAVNAQGVEAVGVSAAGAPSTLVIEGFNTQVTANEQAGVAAQGGAVVTIRDGALVDLNPGGGVLAGGYGTVVHLDRASVLSNGGPGVTATGGALVQTTTAGAGSLRTFVNDNDGGLAADGGGSVQMGSCKKNGGPCTNAGHEIRDNSPGGAFFDAQAVGGSAVRAQGNDWGVPDVACLDLERDPSSTITVAPVLPSGSPCGTSADRTAGGVAAAFERAGGETAARGMTAAVLALVVDAEDALEGGDAPGAAAAIRRALGLATSDDDRAGAFAGAARLLMRAPMPRVVAALDSAAATGARPYALGALAVGHASAGRALDADAAAAALATEYAGTAHAAGGLGVRARLAAEAGDEGSALGHLGALYAVAPASGAFTTAAAVVAAAFPAADLPGALRAGSPAEEALAGKTGAEDGATASALSVAVWPNPSVGASQVRVAVPADGVLDVAVYDALGRRVATLAEGTAAGAGAFQASVPSLPAGVYLVRAAHHADGGGVVAVAVARLTFVR